jgi:hypothetical protein
MVDLEKILVVAVVVLVGKIVWDWLKKGKNGRNTINVNPCIECQKLVKDMSGQILWLKEIHSKTNSDGIPIWYFPRKFTEDLSKMHNVMIATNAYLEQILQQLKDNQNTYNAVAKAIHESR